MNFILRTTLTMAEDQRNSIVSGFVKVLSHKKPCSDGRRCHFDVVIQDTESTTKEVIGFGDDTYEKIKPYSDSKSPVKFQVVNNPGYRRQIFNEKCWINDGKHHDVPFQYCPDIPTPTSSNSQPLSEKANVKDLLDLDPKKYFTVQGKLHIGKRPVQMKGNNRTLKDDITLFYSTGKVPLTMWNKLWERCATNTLLELTHLKISEYGGKHLTTTHLTKIKAVKDDDCTNAINIPEGYCFDDGDSSVCVKQVEDVGLVNIFSNCMRCGCKVKEGDIRSLAFTCSVCKKNRRNEELASTFIVPVNVLYKGDMVTLNITKEVAQRFKPEATADNISDLLLTVENIQINYNSRNNFASTIQQLEETWSDS